MRPHTPFLHLRRKSLNGSFTRAQLTIALSGFSKRARSTIASPIYYIPLPYPSTLAQILSVFDMCTPIWASSSMPFYSSPVFARPARMQANPGMIISPAARCAPLFPFSPSGFVQRSPHPPIFRPTPRTPTQIFTPMISGGPSPNPGIRGLTGTFYPRLNGGIHSHSTSTRSGLWYPAGGRELWLWLRGHEWVCTKIQSPSTTSSSFSPRPVVEVVTTPSLYTVCLRSRACLVSCSRASVVRCLRFRKPCSHSDLLY